MLGSLLPLTFPFRSTFASQSFDIILPCRVTVNFPVKNLELKDYIPLPKAKAGDKQRTKYDLIANLVHDGKPGEGSYRVFVQRKSDEMW